MMKSDTRVAEGECAEGWLTRARMSLDNVAVWNTICGEMHYVCKNVHFFWPPSDACVCRSAKRDACTRVAAFRSRAFSEKMHALA